MGHLRSRPRRDQRGDAGIAEQIEDPRRPAGIGDMALEPFPMGRLFRKHADMAERGEPPEESQAVIGNRPDFSEAVLVAPAPIGLLVADADEMRVRQFPLGVAQPRQPHGLGLGPGDAIGAVTLELEASTGVEERVVVPPLGLEHDRRAANQGAALAGLRVGGSHRLPRGGIRGLL